MQINFRRLPGACMPTKSHPNDAGFDLYAYESDYIHRGDLALIRTGVMVDIPAGYCGIIKGRSGLARDNAVDIFGGVIDAGYTGEIVVIAINLGDIAWEITEGDRVAQLLILPVPKIEWCDVTEFAVSERGGNGFGSTGV